MDDIAENKHFQFGTENPTLMEKPFWKYMVCHPQLTDFCVTKHQEARQYGVLLDLELLKRIYRMDD